MSEGEAGPLYAEVFLSLPLHFFDTWQRDHLLVGEYAEPHLVYDWSQLL